MTARSVIFSLFFVLLTSLAIAQTATIRGFVYDEETEEPGFANVTLKGTNLGASTDVNGFFTISKIPAGTYTIVVTSVGFNPIEEEVTLKAGQLINKKFFLSTGLELQEVVIDAKAEEAKTQVKMSMTQVTPKEINKIPTVGGEADIAQALQVIPGVVFTGDQGGQLYTRGGSPVQM